MKQKAYAAAGVDIDLGNKVKATLPQLLARTHRREVLGKVGGFGGLFQLDLKKYREPILVSSVDGVGTKLKIAFTMDKHDTIGADLVNHCVNDIAVLGAEPLFFLDYLGTGKLEPHVFTEIIKGFVRACAENNCALIGGETAQMAGFYQKGEYDLSGTIVGVVEKSRMLNGQKTVRAGDVVIGIESSGMHTNGYSLGRKIFFEQLKLKPTSRVPGLKGTIGQELLKEHISYGPLVQKLVKKFNPAHAPRTTHHVRAFAHITGGGFVDNIPRVLPKSLDVVIRKGSWDMLPIFQIIEQKSGVPDQELYQVFNMGIGMVSIVSADKADAVLKFIRGQKHKAWLIGEVVKGTGEARVESGSAVTAQLNHRLMPIERGDRYEDPLDEMLRKFGYGETDGGGTLVSKEGEIEHIDVELKLFRVAESLPRVIKYLESRGAPKGSKLVVREGKKERKIPFGKREGIGVYLDGVNLPKETYENCDVNVIIRELNRLLKSQGSYHSYWQGPKETALYFYGKSSAKMRKLIAPFVATYPLCKGARVLPVTPTGK